MTPFRLPLARPDIQGEDKALVQQVLDSAQLSRGPMVSAFEQAFASALSCRHAVAVSSGSAALHLALRALAVEPGQEVITSAFTVPATANMIIAAGAKVRFCDIEADTLGLDPQAAADAVCEQTGALMPVHVFGIAAALPALLDLARARGVPVIEDACEALGSHWSGRALGTLGDCGSFGFYPNKQLTTGEGGMLVTDRDDVADQARQLRNHGRTMDGRWLDQDLLGFNYRMAELPAALGLGQIRRLPQIVAQRRQVAEWYGQFLQALDQHLSVPAGLLDASVCPFALVVLLHEPQQRDPMIQWLAEQGIQTGRYFAPLHLQPAWRERGHTPGQYPVTEALAERTLALPFYPQLSQADVASVCRALAKGLQSSRGRQAGVAS